MASRPIVNLVLFILTVISTLFVGSLYGGDLNGITQVSDLFLPQNIIKGWPFCFTLLGILVAHEFGHYFAARYHKVAVSLPFFIPLPVGFGTLGAFIRLKEPVPDRRKLFDIGVAGPLAGLVIAVPLLFLGLSTSPVDIPPVNANVQLEGNSILYYFAKIAVFGRPLPDLLTREDVFMNQVTFAAWIGLLVTALNLLPVGQLDGGHTVYALFGRYARYANWVTLAVMGLLAIAGIEQIQSFWPFLRNIGFAGWWLWLGLIIFVLGPYHPPALDDVTQLDGRRRLLGYFVILCFILTFVPTPFREL
jgi:membrane-associated protease RseP (regulator of RpoE activity)